MNSSEIREAIDTACDAAKKASAMMCDFFNNDAGGSITDPIQVMHDMFNKQTLFQGEEERCLFDWVCQRRAILIRLGIVDDYVNKITDTLDQLPDDEIKTAHDVRSLSRFGKQDNISKKCEQESEFVLDAFMKSLSPEQLSLYIRVESDLVAKTIREMECESKVSA